MALSEEYHNVDPIEMRGFDWFQYYIRFCDTNILNAIKSNMDKFIRSKSDYFGMQADAIFELLSDSGAAFMSDDEINIVFDYADNFGIKFEHVFFPLFKKTYDYIIKSKDVLLYLMFSKYTIYSIEKNGDGYIAKEHENDEGYNIKTFDDAYWFYEITEFKDDLFDAMIQNDWEESFIQNPLLFNNIKYSYFVQNFCINIMLLNDLFVDELKNFD